MGLVSTADTQDYKGAQSEDKEYKKNRAEEEVAYGLSIFHRLFPFLSDKYLVSF